MEPAWDEPSDDVAAGADADADGKDEGDILVTGSVDKGDELGRLATAVDSGLLSTKASLALNILLTVTFSYAHPGTAASADTASGNL